MQSRSGPRINLPRTSSGGSEELAFEKEKACSQALWLGRCLYWSHQGFVQSHTRYLDKAFLQRPSHDLASFMYVYSIQMPSSSKLVLTTVLRFRFGPLRTRLHSASPYA